MNTVKTMKVSGGEYAKVADRLKLFREKCPRGLIETHPTIQGDTIMFSARIVSDKADEYSSEATGHSMSSKKSPKEFEKQETIAVGRALAMLGYLASGEIASSEEMEEFESFKDQKNMEEMMRWQSEIDAIQTKEELTIYYAKNKGKGKEFDKYIAEKANQFRNTSA